MLPAKVRTRFAPSPTGMMHVGNLRTALYEYLVARSLGGSFILRIEDTDQQRLTEGATDIIYQTLREVGLEHDEGPDIGGAYGPYVQSERQHIYRPYAEQLVKEDKAYYCFCSRERLESLRSANTGQFSGYDRHCRDLDPATVKARLGQGQTSVIRQKMPLTGKTSFTDAVFETISVDNVELEDQVLLKSDGFPTYNFANVIDDHLMQITHVVRGSEYLSSTPKYNLLYDAFGWTIPTYVHLPLILGSDGRKLSKRHGSTGFADLVAEGYLPGAIINAIALLGWCPKDNQEIFSLAELGQVFSIDGISKSPSVFDYDKLAWFNATYIKALAPELFLALARPELEKAFAGRVPQPELLAELLQSRVSRLTQIADQVDFLVQRLPFELDLFYNKRNKTGPAEAKNLLPQIRQKLAGLQVFDLEQVKAGLAELAASAGLKIGQVMWPLRIALSGQPVTPGGAVEIAVILGQEEALDRIDLVLEQLTSYNQAMEESK